MNYSSFQKLFTRVCEVYPAAKRYNPQLLYAQADLETAGFKSSLYERANNMYGMNTPSSRNNHIGSTPSSDDGGSSKAVYADDYHSLLDLVERHLSSWANVRGGSHYISDLKRTSYASDPNYGKALTQRYKTLFGSCPDGYMDDGSGNCIQYDFEPGTDEGPADGGQSNDPGRGRGVVGAFGDFLKFWLFPWFMGFGAMYVGGVVGNIAVMLVLLLLSFCVVWHRKEKNWAFWTSLVLLVWVGYKYLWGVLKTIFKK